MALTPIDYSSGQDLNSDVFDKINAIITAVNELQGGTADQIFKKTNSTDFNFEACNSILPASGTGNIKVKKVQIGDWNMDSTASVDVAHGVSDYKTILFVTARIRDDSDAIYSLLTSFGQNATAIGPGVDLNGKVVRWDSTNVVLTRETSQHFDSTDYNSTSFNRGDMFIFYEA
jgi:hypothetical protein